MGVLKWNVDEQFDDRVEKRGFVGHEWVGARDKRRRIGTAANGCDRWGWRREELSHERSTGGLPGTRRRARAQHWSCGVRQRGTGRGGRGGGCRIGRCSGLSRWRGWLETVEQLDQLVVACLANDVSAYNSESKQRVG